jgi:Flp pilus assembly protein TadG
VAVILIAFLLVFLMGVVALGIDVGYLYMNRAQLQTCADSGSLAGAEALLSDAMVKATPDYSTGQSAARAAAVQFASANKVGTKSPNVNSNSSNDPNGDVVIGYLADPTNPSCQLLIGNPALYNAVQVRVRKSEEQNGLVAPVFSRVWGNPGNAVAARATSVVSSSIVGFRVTDESGNVDLLPFAVKKTDWDALIAGAGADDYSSDSDGNVQSGGDGILELDMYPLSNGTGGVVPGNFGTVDVGSADNSTADLERQIVYGVSKEDLEALGGALMLGSDGTLQLNGDTGVSAGLKDELERVKGKRRSILLYSTVVEEGNTAMYTIVGFAGVRVLHVNLTGSMAQKKVVIQPAIVVDGTAIVGTTPNDSKYVFSNVRLAR